MNAQQILSGLGWSAAATVVTAACQVVFLAVLARLLDPAAFGLMAMASIALRFAAFFAQMGFAQALIQRSQIEAEDTTAALIMAITIGAAMCGATVLAAPLFADSFRAPELAALISALSASLILTTVGSLPIALLRRRARFKRVNGIETISFILGYGAVGIGCAFEGAGVWSLVAATLCQQVLVAVLGFWSVRFPLKWPVASRAFSEIWAYGSRHSLIGFLEFVSANVEILFIGRYLGKIELGLFNRANMLANLPVELGISAVNKVLFPALSGMQNDRARLADGFRMLLLTTGIFSSAIALGIAAAAPDAVLLLLGERWIDIAPIVAILALAVPPMFMYVACGVTLDSLATLRPKLKLQTLVLLLKAAFMLLLAGHGLIGMAACVVLAESVRLALGITAVAKALDIKPREIWYQVALCTLAGLVVATAVALVACLGSTAALPLAMRVPLEAIAGAASLAIGIVLLAVRFPRYAPLQRFEVARRWHANLLSVLHLSVAHP